MKIIATYAPPPIPDRNYDVSDGAKRTCVAALPYPAKRCGVYVVKCRACGKRVGCTTAGRPDDPRSIKIACAHRNETVQ